jgi:hypothetical protein
MIDLMMRMKALEMGRSATAKSADDHRRDDPLRERAAAQEGPHGAA